MRNILFITIVILLATACAAIQPEPTSTPLPLTEPPPPTDTSIPPTSSPSPIEATFEVTFDGIECSVSGPTELPVGEHSFLYINQTTRRVDLWVFSLTDDKTYQNFLDFINEVELGEFFEKPEWAKYTGQIGVERIEDGRIENYSLEEGEYAICCGSYSNFGIWEGAPLQVIETPSE